MKSWIKSFIFCTILGISIGYCSGRNKIAKEKQHKYELFQHESSCYELQACLETSLTFSNDTDMCYPIDPLWGWSGEKSETLVDTCNLFKRIRRTNGQLY